MLRRLIGLLIVLLAAACGPEPVAVTIVPTDIPTVIPTPNLPVNDAGVAVVARVNGTEITLPQFERAVSRAQQESVVADPSLLRLQVLDTLIEQVLIDQAAVQMNITVTDAEIDAELDANVQLAGGEQAWQNWLSANQYTQDEFRETLRATLVTARVRDAVTQQTATVSTTIEEVHARHILVRTEAEANDLLARLQAGEDFATLATLSLDVTTRDSGGDLGWFTRDELMEQSLADVAFALEPGQIAGPVPTRLGYHIIQTLEVHERAAEAEDQASLAQNRFQDWLEQQRQNAAIERFI
ncbi:MAG: peptidylprolyl isomerase [Anaerolineae bacterium]